METPHNAELLQKKPADLDAWIAVTFDEPINSAVNRNWFKGRPRIEWKFHRTEIDPIL